MDDKIKLVRERITELKTLIDLSTDFLEQRSLRGMLTTNESILALLYGGWEITVSPCITSPTIYSTFQITPFLEVKN